MVMVTTYKTAIRCFFKVKVEEEVKPGETFPKRLMGKVLLEVDDEKIEGDDVLKYIEDSLPDVTKSKLSSNVVMYSIPVYILNIDHELRDFKIDIGLGRVVITIMLSTKK